MVSRPPHFGGGTETSKSEYVEEWSSSFWGVGGVGGFPGQGTAFLGCLSLVLFFSCSGLERTQSELLCFQLKVDMFTSPLTCEIC